MSKPRRTQKPRYTKHRRTGKQTADHARPSTEKTRNRPTQQPSAPSSIITLEPLAPLIIRSGRPFDDQAGADTARFPPPSTIAGAMRTACAREQGKPFGPQLAEVAVHAPLLVRPGGDESIRWLVPKPADALYFGHGEQARCVRAQPGRFDSGCGADFPAELLPLRLSEHQSAKAGAGPSWWDLQDLLAFRQGESPGHDALSARGWTPPPGERRTQVAIDPNTGAADAGRLFQTEGLDFEPTNHLLDVSMRSAPRLLVRCGAPLGSGLVHLGGERRLAQIQPQAHTLWPRPPADWLDRLLQAGGLTLTLMTPGCFDKGWRPGWLDAALIGCPPNAPGLRLRLRAAALDRWQAQSGWDLHKQAPRRSRKLVPSGATYWFELLDSPEPAALAGLWLGSLSDFEQDRRDGYALALPAAWQPID